MKHLYLAYLSYEVNTAGTNRIVAYIKSLSNLGIRTTVVFFLPDVNFSKFSQKHNLVDFIYCWEFYCPKTKIGRVLALKFYYKWFRSILKRGDNVFVYGQVNLIHELVKKSGINIYNEMTEHPEAIGYRNPITSVSWYKYYEDCKRLSGLFVISTGLKDFYINKGIASEKIVIVNMTVDPSRFVNLKKSDSEKYIAYCGTAINNKDGVDELIKSFGIFAKSNQDYKLYIIGPKIGNVDMVKNMDIVNEFGIADRVVLTGVIPAERIPQVLLNARALVLDRPNNIQSIYGFPTKLGEYLLTGNPVVVTRVGDIDKFLQDGKSALIAEPNNATDFSAKLLWVINNPDKAKQIGERGKMVALKSFNAGTETRKIINFIFKD